MQVAVQILLDKLSVLVCLADLGQVNVLVETPLRRKPTEANKPLSSSSCPQG